MSNIVDFYNYQFKQNKNEPTHMINNLTATPRKEKSVDIPHISNNILAPNVFQVADLLYVPSDAFGYKYILVVVDVFNKNCDAEPLKYRDAPAVLKAFEKLYARKILEVPYILQCDGGSEFKGLAEQELFENEQIRIKYALPNRHRQQSLVERKNKEIGSTIIKFQSAQELLKHQVVKGWVKHLPELIKAINKRASQAKQRVLTHEVLSTKYSQDLIPLHSHVRAILDYPINPATKARIGNIFRSGDLRFGLKDRTVEKIILNPNLPPMYMLNGHNNGLDNRVAYTKQQLQVIPKNEIGLNTDLLNLNKTVAKPVIKPVEKVKRNKTVVEQRIQPARMAKK